MKKYICSCHKYLFFLLLPVFYTSLSCLDIKPPRLTIIFVVDQFAYHYLPRLERYLHGGIKFLMINGVNYKNAYWPHALPSTSIGHTGLNTGAFATYHGIIGNSWRNEHLQKVASDDDLDQQAAVFSPEGFYTYGKSARNIMVDGVSEQLMLESCEGRPITVFAISYKSNAAIGNAGKLGKAIWFDTKAGCFTSSKAYFDQVPLWVKQFNKKHPFDTLAQQKWNLFYHQDSAAYPLAEAPQYQITESTIGKKVINFATNSKNSSRAFIESPMANELLLDLAKEFLDNHLTRNKDSRIVLWVSLSPLDKLCHIFGPHSRETIDMIYHLDYQLKRFFSFVRKHIAQSDVLYVLTADHGVEPIPEWLQEKGLKNARRILIPALVKGIEEYIQNKHGITIKCAIKVPQVYFDKTFDQLDKGKQQNILKDIKNYLQQQEGIKKAWLTSELSEECINKDQIEYYYKNQQFPGRSGSVVFQVFPYTLVTKHTIGTGHRTPYEWNTHVPLIFYQKGVFEHKVINERVWLLQFANSLAQIHKIPKPSASTFSFLPGLFPAEDVSY
jgi:predicted AlkP superfamily pyrophosphatase or phosphodiesterase